MPWKVLLRDLILGIIVSWGWAWAYSFTYEHWYAIIMAMGTALFGFFVHEWGHWIGGKLGGAHLKINNSWTAFFLFKFYKDSTIKSYIWLSMGGYLSSLLLVVLLVKILPEGSLARWYTLGLVALGVAATLLIEVPELIGTIKRGSYPNGFAYTEEKKP